MRAWFAISTKGSFVAARGLRAQGYEVYLPKKHIGEQVGRRYRAYTVLRFDGYAFVRFDPELGEQGPLSNTRGVGGLVPPYPAPLVPIEDEIIGQLHAAEDAEIEAIRERAQTKSSTFSAGQTVRIHRGQAAGMHGQVVGSARGIVTLFIGTMISKIAEGDCTLVPAANGGKA